MTKFQKIQLIDSNDDDVIPIDRSRIVKIPPFNLATEDGLSIACDRGGGELEGSIVLNDIFDYVLTKDSAGIPCLVVLEKKLVNNR